MRTIVLIEVGGALMKNSYSVLRFCNFFLAFLFRV